MLFLVEESSFLTLSTEVLRAVKECSFERFLVEEHTNLFRGGQGETFKNLVYHFRHMYIHVDVVQIGSQEMKNAVSNLPG